MKKALTFLATFVIVILIIPIIALVGNTKPETPSAVNATPNFQTIHENTAPSAPGTTLYSVQNHLTGVKMELEPKVYLRGVVAAEMPISFHSEALKAQAVAAHTYIFRQIDEQSKKPNPDLGGAMLSTNPATSQAYISVEELKERWGKNFDLNYKKLCEAVDSVANEIIVFEKKPIIAAFHSLSGGKTESALTVWGQDVSYLTPVKSEGDELSPNFNVKSVLTSDEIEHAFKTKYPEITFPKDKSTWFSILEKSESNTITKIKVGSIECSGRDVRELLKLKSANFELVYKDGDFEFTTSGYGHGVGMSQYGADYLARQGSSYDEIIKHYYKGVMVVSS